MAKYKWRCAGCGRWLTSNITDDQYCQDCYMDGEREALAEALKIDEARYRAERAEIERQMACDLEQRYDADYIERVHNG